MTELEEKLAAKFGFENQAITDPKAVFQQLGAFWHHWNLHKRRCDKTGDQIISVFRPDCPYPIWQKDVWMSEAAPPMAQFDPNKLFFEQLWDLWQRSPIPHNFQSQNQNCEYTDDWYESKNCYLCHSGQHNEDCRYCYGCDTIKDCYWTIFSFNSELCADLINSKRCFNSLYLLNCQQLQDSAFCYDCRNCTDCLFCFNLRDKKYCFGNQQLTKEEFEIKKAEWNFTDPAIYQKAKQHFADMMPTLAWHRAQLIDKSEDTTGNFLENCRQAQNCYLLTRHEECVNVLFSGPDGKTVLNALGTIGTELSYMSVLPVYCYETRFCFATNNSKFCDYSAFLFNCQYCFGCCGLVNKKYHIFNKPYPEAEYHVLKEKIIDHMKRSGEWGQWFPPHFAASPYDESLSGYYFPLAKSEQEAQGYWYGENLEKKSPAPSAHWDEVVQKPYIIDDQEETFCQKLNLAPNDRHYMRRIQENLKWLNWTGGLRATRCAKSGVDIQTNWPAEYDQRVLCEAEYLKIVK